MYSGVLGNACRTYRFHIIEMTRITAMIMNNRNFAYRASRIARARFRSFLRSRSGDFENYFVGLEKISVT